MKRTLLKTLDALGGFSMFNPFTKNSATIFMLHSVAAVNDGRDVTSPALLEECFSYLKRNGYRVLSLRNYVQALENRESTYKSVVFTVDDGYRDFYEHAYAVFKKYGYSATIFLTSDFINRRIFLWWDQIEFSIQNTLKTEVDVDGLGKVAIGTASEKSEAIFRIIHRFKKIPNAQMRRNVSQLVEQLGVDVSGQPSGKYSPLSWAEILEMQANGIEFHPHTQNHPILTRLNAEDYDADLRESKDQIESHLGISADILCYPNGGPEDFSDGVIEEAKKAGYRAAVTGIPGFNNTQANTDMYRLGRFGLPTDSLLFKEYVCGMEALKFRLRPVA